ncbi:glycosyltransferase family 2 protein [Demequina sp.]|uniref:glycosyltransferase family 2 protein n=1 Tax=Demequina sp. TaxID=2050685 RepID=UPI003A8797BF
MSPARIVVRAVVVADGRTTQVHAALDAVLSQDPAPDVVHLALTGPLDPPPGGWDRRLDVIDVEAHSFGTAIEAVLAANPGDDSELLWLLHDDMAPLPGALAALAATARKRRLAGVVGAAQVQWDSPDRLVSLGMTTTRVGARRIAMVEEDDVDQGQYAQRDDVLAVSLGGALVRRELWTVLEGLDGAGEGWSSSLDFCRRAWRAGYDVVAVPGARVRHSQERLYGRRGGSGGGRRATYGARRASEWYHALVFSPWWAVPLLFVWASLASGARAVLRIAQNEPRLLTADLLVPWRLILLLPRLPRARWRAHRSGKATQAERQLLAGPRDVARHVRALEWGARSRARAAAQPSDVARRELTVLARRRRTTAVALAVLLAGFSVALHPEWISALVQGQMLTGSTLGVTDASVGELWARAITGWSTQGLGAPAIDAGLSMLLLPFALAPGGLALWLGLTLAFAPLLAGMSAWAATGAVTRSLWMRLLASAAYAVWPIAAESVAQGRVAAVLVHIVAPLAVVGLIRAGGWHRGELLGDGTRFPVQQRPTRSAAAGASAAIAVLVIAAPVLLAPALMIVAVAGACAGRTRWKVWGIVVVPLIVSAPGLIAAASAGSLRTAGAILAREPGPSATSTALSGSDLLLGGIGETGAVPLPLVVALRALPVLILVAALLAGVVARRRLLCAGALLTAAGGVALAVVVQSLTLSPDAGADGPAATGWYGAPMTLAVLALLVAACAAFDGDVGAREAAVVTADAGANPRTRARQWGAGLGVAACSVVVLGAATAYAWPGAASLGDVAPSSRDALPLVAALEQGSVHHQRVLVIDQVDETVSYAVMSTDGTEVLSTAATLIEGAVPAVRGGGAAPVAGPAAFGPTVASLVAGGSADVDLLADWGIGVVVAAPGADAVADALSQHADLHLMGSADRGTSWRVGAAEGADRVSRATFVGADGASKALAISADGVSFDAPGPGTVVLAEAADDRWIASLDGQSVAGATDELGRQVFALAEGGQVVARYDDRGYRVWAWATVVALAWALVAAIPVGSRRARAEEVS